MGLNIVLTDCNGEFVERIDDPRNLLHRLLPPADEESESVLTKIDWYGDTYFNHLQICGSSGSGMNWSNVSSHPRRKK
jgi:hypothetical protein